MNRRTFRILFVIFIVLGGYVWLFELERVNESDSVMKTEKLIDVSPEDVGQIILKTQDHRIVFQKENNQWMITEPLAAKARNEMVDGLLSVFDLGIVREISIDSADDLKYGLAPPAIEFEIRYKTGDPPQTLLIGNNSPDSICCYGKLKKQSRIFLLGSLYKSELNQKLETFID